MSWLEKVRKVLEYEIAPEAKALSSEEFRFPGQPSLFFNLPNSPELGTMAREVGDGTSSDLLMTPIRWLQRAVMEAPLVEVDKDGEPKPGDLQALIDKPNKFYAFEHLMAGTIFSLAIDGNAYWLPVVNKNDRLFELWYIPHTEIEPKWPRDGSEFISHYLYTPSGAAEKKILDPGDVIHFREGIDPQNLRKGLSPLKGLLREVWTDNEAAAFTAALLKNGGVPGIVASPASPEFNIEPEEAEAIKAKLKTTTTRNSRGEPIVVSGPVKLEQFGFSPQELDLSPLRDISEERVTAALGVPAAVVGFGSGLQQTKVGATMKELRQLAWYNGVIPLLKIISSEVDRSLAPAVKAEGAEFDLEAVSALRENQDSLASRMERLVRAGILTRGEAKAALGYEATEADDVYMLPFSAVIVPAGQMPEESQEPEKGLKHHGSLVERRIAESATRPASVPTRLREFAEAMDNIRHQADEFFVPLLAPVFQNLGRQVQQVAQRLLEERRSADDGETKQEEIEGELVRTILDEVSFDLARDELRGAYTRGYGEVAKAVFEALKVTLGADIILTDPEQLEILEAGGLRMGLVDLEAQTRDALFSALSEAREEGLAGENLARRIRQHVEAGPWRNVETRARVIARTEGAYAANTSVLRAARGMEGVERMMMHDNRTGFDDGICAEIDGLAVTLDEADALIAAEHPNGTRSATPIPPLLAEEMGL